MTDIGRGDLTVPVWESVDGHWTRGLNSSCLGVLTDIVRGDLTVPVWESVDGHWTRGLNSYCLGEC